MNTAGLAKGAIIGALLGAAWTGFRTYGTQKSNREPLPSAAENLHLIDADLVQLLQELRDMAMLPPAHHATFAKQFTDSIGLIERICAIEVQIERQEIVASFRDSTEAAQLAEAALRCLRSIESLFESIELRQQFRTKVSDIQAQLGNHLSNINVECLQY